MKSLEINNIPFEDIGVERHRGEHIATTIRDYLSQNPQRPIEVQQIANLTRTTGSEVKKIFYFLLYERELQATYIPFHKNCDKPLGLPEKSVDIIKSNIESDEYHCMHCLSSEIPYPDIEVRIIFWSKEIDVSN